MKTSTLALFDLDQTLIPIDSDRAWGDFLVQLGIVDAQIYAQKNQEFYEAYKAGVLDIHLFLRFALAPLAKNSREQLNIWHQQFMQTVITPTLSKAAHALIQKHKTNNDLCAIVTATNSFITRPIAQAFGIDHLIATEPATIDNDPDANFTGGVNGLPNFKEGKVTRTESWLSSMGLGWDSFEKIYFYSDSINDLPLLEKVNTPVATNPDSSLRTIAQTRGWPVLDLFQL